MNSVAIIPSRLESSRLPHKALKDICGIPMIIHVVKRCKLSNELSEVFVATDSKEIFDVVTSWGGKVIMTSSEHQTGTDRIAEAAKNIEADLIVNVQGDEALVSPKDIDSIVIAMNNNLDINVGILVSEFEKENSTGDIKVVLNENSEVMYLSRSDIPSSSRTNNRSMLKAYHVVPFRKEFLFKYTSWKPTELESIEFNEYLRILEKGEKIKAVKVQSNAISVDTKEDLVVVRELMKRDPLYLLYSQQKKSKNFLI